MILSFKNFESVRWGSIGAGILPFCKKTNRFLIAYRSKFVYEPHTWGIWGGKIESGDNNIEHSAIREFQEECGYNGEIDIIPSYVYKESTFTYYNFIGLVDSEFEPNLEILNEFGEIETEDYQWISLQELLNIENKHFGLIALLKNNYNQLEELLLEKLDEGIDFEGNFTPLYHITNRLDNILKSDSLIPGNPARGPKGICLTRSKFFEHSGLICRIILNRELLLRNGYKIYPLDEWALSRIDKSVVDTKFKSWRAGAYPVKRGDWVNKSVIKTHHFGKSNFEELKKGRRPISHNIKGLPNKDNGLEVEYEERILKPVGKLHKYLYAINFIDNNIYERNKEIVTEYIKKYPGIKILIGKFRFEEVK